jgi:hypothetical protein
MADQQQIALLLSNSPGWNAWRFQQPEICPDLSRANLMNADLRSIDLRKVDLHDAYLRGANLSGADLSGADLRNIDLSKANLSGARLNYTNLAGANLRYAKLLHADLYGTDLGNAMLDKAVLGWTCLGSVDLRTAKGLDTVQHLGPSEISTHTLVRSHGRISEAFLRGAGLDNGFIEYTYSLVRRPAAYYNCFISYALEDQDFARRLYIDLQTSGIRCWLAPEEIKVAGTIDNHLYSSMQLDSKFVLVLSESAIASSWVVSEVETALAREEQGKATVLFPLRLDDAVFTVSAEWLTSLKRSKHLADFSQWRRNEQYLKSLNRLLHDLDVGAR